MKSFKTPLHHTSWWAGEKRSFQIETSKCNICIGSGLHQGPPEKGDVDGLRVFNCRKCFTAMLQIIIWHQLKEQIYQIKARHELAYFSLKICSGKFELWYNWNMMHISGISENDLNIYTLKYAKSMPRLRIVYLLGFSGVIQGFARGVDCVAFLWNITLLVNVKATWQACKFL